MSNRVYCLQALVIAGWVGALAGTTIALDMPRVYVGNAGNTADTRYATPGYGAVGSTYWMGKFEVTTDQYTEFLNKMAKTDTYGLYNPNMDTAVDSFGCNIKRSGSPGNYTYSVASDWANRPVNFVSWGDAARFANWMHNGQPTGVQNASTTENGSYSLSGATSDAALLAVTRKAGATWVIPSEDEWYKAAFYDPNKPGGPGYWDYPTGTNNPITNTLVDPDPGNNANFETAGYLIGPPYYRTLVGEFENSASPYGTFDQAGNMWEWNEAVLSGQFRGMRGGCFDTFTPSFLSASDRHYYYPSAETSIYGFRVALVPEPATMALLVVGGLGILGRRRRR